MSKTSFTLGKRYRRQNWLPGCWLEAEWFNEWYLAGVDQDGRKRSYDYHELGDFVPYGLKQYIVTTDDTQPLEIGDVWIGTLIHGPFLIENTPPSRHLVGHTGYQKIIRIEEVPS